MAGLPHPRGEKLIFWGPFHSQAEMSIQVTSGVNGSYKY